MERRQMPGNYEFGYQSTKQKLILLGLKVFVAVLTTQFFYSLGWVHSELQDKLHSIAGIICGFWVYTNLLKVKIEVQELFVEPIEFEGTEFIFVGLAQNFYATYLMFANWP